MDAKNTDNDTAACRSLSTLRQVLVVVAVAGLAAAAFIAMSLKPAQTAPVEVAPNPVPDPTVLKGLTVKPVGQMTFRDETVTDGQIALDDDLVTPVFSPFSGRVTRVIAKLGDRVQKGSPLLSVEATEFVQAQSDLIAARAQFSLAQTNERRQHELYDSQGAALKDWQQAQVDLATAQASLAAVRNRLHILGKSDAEIDALEGATMATSSMNPESIVEAPISGTIVKRQVGAGQYIQAGASDPVFAVGNLSTVWLVANVREADAPAIHPGDPIEVRVLAFPERVFRARISYLAPAMDPSTHRLAVRADIENRDGLLKPQMFATFTIFTGREIAAVGVPESAIIREGESARVWVVNAHDGLAIRQIETGKSNNDMVEVVRGLTPGEKIVTSGAIFIDRAASTR
jgi:cobalt-zinc-cadmium efflux system membrane fusion protein